MNKLEKVKFRLRVVSGVSSAKMSSSKRVKKQSYRYEVKRLHNEYVDGKSKHHKEMKN